jgi:hypothetical protein
LCSVHMTIETYPELFTLHFECKLFIFWICIVTLFSYPYLLNQAR